MASATSNIQAVPLLSGRSGKFEDPETMFGPSSSWPGRRSTRHKSS